MYYIFQFILFINIKIKLFFILNLFMAFYNPKYPHVSLYNIHSGLLNFFPRAFIYRDLYIPRNLGFIRKIFNLQFI